MDSPSAFSALSLERACERKWSLLHVAMTLPVSATVPHSPMPHPHACPTLCRNMAEALISKGYGKALRHRQDDDLRSSCYDELLSAEARAEKNRKGLFTKKEYTPIKVADFSGVSSVWRVSVDKE